MADIKSIMNTIMANIKYKKDADSNFLYALFDKGGQGIRNSGLLGVFTSKKKASKSVNGDGWYSIIKIKLNVFYKDGWENHFMDFKNEKNKLKEQVK